jgi:hypothetical protein
VILHCTIITRQVQLFVGGIRAKRAKSIRARFSTILTSFPQKIDAAKSTSRINTLVLNSFNLVFNKFNVDNLNTKWKTGGRLSKRRVFPACAPFSRYRFSIHQSARAAKERQADFVGGRRKFKSRFHRPFPAVPLPGPAFLFQKKMPYPAAGYGERETAHTACACQGCRRNTNEIFHKNFFRFHIFSHFSYGKKRGRICQGPGSI